MVQPERLQVRRWDDEVVVYDDRSGDTHLLDDACGRVLERLLDSSASDAELERLCASVDGEAPDAAQACLYDVLKRLRRLDIVKPVRK